MKKPESIARRLSHVSGNETSAKPIGITEIVEGAQCTAAYIAKMTGELANIANGARFQSLAHLLARAQLEAELWSRQSQWMPSIFPRSTASRQVGPVRENVLQRQDTSAPPGL